MAKTIRIGHASTDTPSSGSGRDEVLIGTFYDSLEHNIVLRPITRELAEKSALACEAGCKNDNIEYSQSSRNTLNTEALKVGYNLDNITTKCYADCSSFMTVCAIAGGANISYNGSAPNCGTMRERFKNSGDYKVLEVASEPHLKTSDYLMRGDILVREHYKNGSRHTVMILDNGSKVPSISSPFIADYFAIKITVAITDIGNNKATVVSKITKIENGKEIALPDAAMGTYEWVYNLTPLTISGTKAYNKKVKLAKNSTSFTLDNLSSSSSYMLSITATKKSGEAEYTSPNIIFTTTAKTVPEMGTEIKGTNTNSKICKVFIKIKDSFKRAIIYNKQGE